MICPVLMFTWEVNMRRTELLQEVRKMRFEEVYGGWQQGRLTQEEAAQVLGVSDRTFRRYVERYDDGGLEALLDKRITQISHRRGPGQEWDLIVTMDDATNEHYSMFFVPEEGTKSSFRGIREVFLKRGIFCSLYTDRGSHYWYTPEAGGKVDKNHPTQFGRAMKQMGIEMIPAYSPEARGRSERMFGTHQDRLTKELALHEITDMEAANRYIEEVYLPEFNKEFMQPSLEEGSAFVPWIGGNPDEILCELPDPPGGPEQRA